MKNAIQKHNSSSSEEGITELEISDESLENNETFLLVDRRGPVTANGDGRQPRDNRPGGHEDDIPLTPEEKADQIIKEAELAKAKMLPQKGDDFMFPTNFNGGDENFSSIPFEFVAKVDQEYLVIGGHVDEVMQKKIVAGEYVDFSRLIPKDRMLTGGGQ